MADVTPLRILTYMCPSHSIELYKTIVEYLEKTLQRPCELHYEWRSTGPDGAIVDPFKSNTAGIAFIASHSFQQLSEARNPDWVILPVGAVHTHPTKGDTLGYWADLIIPADEKERIKELKDLRGCRLARPDVSSLSGYIVLLKTLRDLGESSTFFGNVLDSSSHVGSVQMVGLKQADLASVDSVALQFVLEQQPSLKSEIHVLDNLGPLPPYPIVVRANLEDELRIKIEEAFLNMHKDEEWAKRFEKLHVVRFESIDTQVFEIDAEMRKLVTRANEVRYY